MLLRIVLDRMKRKRVKINEYYYFVDMFNIIRRVKEQGATIDKYNFFINNYFRTKKQALNEIIRREAKGERI